jgi:hypothetical protein
VRRSLPIEVRIRAGSVVTATGCWEWIRSKGSDGYAQISVKHKTRRACRVAYEVAGNLRPGCPAAGGRMTPQQTPEQTRPIDISQPFALSDTGLRITRTFDRLFILQRGDGALPRRQWMSLDELVALRVYIDAVIGDASVGPPEADE